jgi:hypothetical protein
MALSPLISSNADSPQQILDPRLAALLSPADSPPQLQSNSMGISSQPKPQLVGGLQPLVTTPRMQREALLQGQISQHETPQKPQGFWQNVRHIAATIGNVAGDVLAPSTMALIPGTQLHGDIQNAQRSNELRSLEDQDQQDSTNASQNASRAASAGEATARTGLLGVQTEQAKKDLNADPPEPDLTHAYAHAVMTHQPQEVIDYILNAIKNAQKEPAPKGAEHVNIVGPDGKSPILASYDPVTKLTTGPDGKVIGNPIPYEKPQQVNVNAADASLDRLAGRLGKPYQAGFDAANKQLETIDKTMRSIDSGYKGQALALPETMTALVSGQGTGVRITQAELNAIGQHNGIKGDIESFFNRISGEGSMTDTDKRQLKAILAETRQRVLDKQQIHKDALDGINGAPDRTAVARSDADARQRINDLERTGHFAGQTVKLKNGQTITIQHVHPDGSFD